MILGVLFHYFSSLGYYKSIVMRLLYTMIVKSYGVLKSVILAVIIMWELANMIFLQKKLQENMTKVANFRVHGYE